MYIRTSSWASLVSPYLSDNQQLVQQTWQNPTPTIDCQVSWCVIASIGVDKLCKSYDNIDVDQGKISTPIGVYDEMCDR